LETSPPHHPPFSYPFATGKRLPVASAGPGKTSYKKSNRTPFYYFLL
jgi:hypothetical protein